MKLVSALTAACAALLLATPTAYAQQALVI
jgi:hypothetical protein